MNGRVLIVEDYRDIADLVEFILNNEGYDTRSTASGTLALQAVAQWDPDLVLLDINVEELSGGGVVRALRDFSTVPVILSTALPPEGEPRRLIELGASALLPKPWTPDDLLSAVAEFMCIIRPQSEAVRSDVRALGSEDLENIADLSPDALDGLPFGAICLSAEGTVLSVNSYERRAAGIAAESVLNRNFFRDVAPCTNVQQLQGAFRDGVRRGELDTSVRFIYPMRGGAARVTVRLYYDAAHGRGWVFASRRPETPVAGTTAPSLQ